MPTDNSQWFIKKRRVRRYLMSSTRPSQCSEEFLETLNAEVELILARAMRRSSMNGRKRVMGQDV